MAEEIVNNPERNLILQNSWEKILARIEECQIRNLSDQEKENLKRQNEALEAHKLQDLNGFLNVFTSLCKNFFGINKAQLKSFNKDELTKIADVIFKSTKNIAAVQKYIFSPLLLLIPVIGWFGIALLRLEDTWAYQIYYSRLKRQYGEDWFPIDVFNKESNG